jgi:DNA gyrase subunit A
MGRSTQGVKVMNIKDDDQVSAVALVVESEGEPEQPEGALPEELPAADEGSVDEAPVEGEGG